MQTFGTALIAALLLWASGGHAADFKVSLKVETANLEDEVTSLHGVCVACSSVCNDPADAMGVAVGGGEWDVKLTDAPENKSRAVEFSFDANPGQDPLAATHYTCALLEISCREKGPEGKEVVEKAPPSLVGNDPTSLKQFRQAKKNLDWCRSIKDPGSVYLISGPIEDPAANDIPDGSDVPFPDAPKDDGNQFEDIKLD